MARKSKQDLKNKVFSIIDMANHNYSNDEIVSSTGASRDCVCNYLNIYKKMQRGKMISNAQYVHDKGVIDMIEEIFGIMPVIKQDPHAVDPTLLDNIVLEKQPQPTDQTAQKLDRIISLLETIISLMEEK